MVVGAIYLWFGDSVVGDSASILFLSWTISQVNLISCPVFSSGLPFVLVFITFPL